MLSTMPSPMTNSIYSSVIPQNKDYPMARVPESSPNSIVGSTDVPTAGTGSVGHGSTHNVQMHDGGHMLNSAGNHSQSDSER